MTATITKAVDGLEPGDTVELLGPVVVGSLVAFAYRLPSGEVPSLPLPADAVRLEPLEVPG